MTTRRSCLVFTLSQKPFPEVEHCTYLKWVHLLYLLVKGKEKCIHFKAFEENMIAGFFMPMKIHSSALFLFATTFISCFKRMACWIVSSIMNSQSCFCIWKLIFLNCFFTWQIKSLKISISPLNCKTSFLLSGHCQSKIPHITLHNKSLIVCLTKRHQCKPEDSNGHLLKEYYLKYSTGNRDTVSELKHLKITFEDRHKL